MFNTESRPITIGSVVESANSVMESADSTANSSPNLARVSVWEPAFRTQNIGSIHYALGSAVKWFEEVQSMVV